MARGKNGGNDEASMAGSRWSIMGSEYQDATPWEGVESEIIGDAVRAVMAAGDAVMFSVTSDGGSARVTIFEGDAKRHQYCPSSATLERLLRGIAQSVD
jgi:hypothetical protein